ncbi:putative uncharacterized protein DDB_G0283051 [Protopterus annectens]|uniref:putative uncharacterized protein DDB_G0283051 n=1 Tax=Protopterus annectens TaxID=7888 RepID=UPI001CFB6CE9|nr:putative uncharacterized protein DDB_G0283051 [Protopterus annectens]
MSLINFYKGEINGLKSELEILEHVIKTDNEFFRYKYDYARIFSIIDATMAKLLATKKRKIARDVQDYASNKAYPRPPFNPNRLGATSYNSRPLSEPSRKQEINLDSSITNTDGEETQPVRRSERLNNMNNNNNNNNNMNNGNAGHQGLNGNNNQRGPNRPSDFQMAQGGRNNHNRRGNRNQGQARNQRNQWRR